MNAMTAIAAVPAFPLAAQAAPAIQPIEAEAATDAELNANYEAGYEDGLSVAREEFALAWLKMWTSAGGSVTIGHDGAEGWIGRPCFRFAPAGKRCDGLLKQVGKQDWFRKLPKREQVAHLNGTRSMHSNMYYGMMRGLEDLLDAIPEGAETIKALVGIAPGLGRGTF